MDATPTQTQTLAPAPVSPSAATTAPAPTTATEPVAAPPVAQPALTAALSRLRSRPSGTHELTVQLHPADLGAVRVVAVLRGDQLDITVLCGDHSAQQAVAAAVPALHDKLAELRQVDISGPAGQSPGSSADGSSRHPSGADARASAALRESATDRPRADARPDITQPARTRFADARFDRRI